MRLELGRFKIRDVKFGKNAELKDGVLTINQEEVLAFIGNDKNIKSINFDIVKPGDSARIVPVKDVIEPRTKAHGPGGIFQGFLPGEEEMSGEGRTHVLDGVAVVTTGNIVGFQEGIIDMSGPGAQYTPFSKMMNIVIACEVNEGLPRHEHEASIRMVGLKAAAFIARVSRDMQPDTVEVYEHHPLFEAVNEYPNLPKVGYIYMLQSQGLLHDTYVYGVDAKRILPTLMSPTEIMDGAIVSGNCVSACDKNPTYVHQNNPIIEELYKHHGKEYNFIGVIVTNENVTLSDKERSSNFTAKLAEHMNLDAVIVSEEGFGNPDADLIMHCMKLAKKGIKVVAVTDEYAGRDGASQSLADANPLADAVITAGNANEVITLPPMNKVIGHPDVANVIAGGFNGSLKADGSMTIEIQAITGATNELGFHNLTATSY